MWVWAILLCLNNGLAHAQESKPIILHKTDSVLSEGVKSFGIDFPIHCDNDGNYFLRLAAVRNGHIEIWKLNAKGEKKAEIKPHCSPITCLAQL